MHEASLIASVLEITGEELRRRAARTVSVVGLRVGAFTGATPEALQLAFEALKEGTAAEHAKLVIEAVPLRCECPACRWQGVLDEFRATCENCGTMLEIRSGRELEIAYLHLET